MINGKHSQSSQFNSAWDSEERRAYGVSEVESITQSSFLDGAQSILRAVQDTLTERTESVAEERDVVRAKLEAMRFHPIAAFLSTSLDKFSILFLLPVEEFFTREFSRIYHFTEQMRLSTLATKNILVAIDFAGVTEVNQDQILADGYSHFCYFEPQTQSR